MDKSPDAFRTISEVAEHLETPAHVLRFWESRFPQIRPVKRAGGRRYYRPSDVSLLTGIKRLLHDEGMTIRGVQKILREQGVRHVAGLSGDDIDDSASDDAPYIDHVEPQVIDVVVDLRPEPPAYRPPPSSADAGNHPTLADVVSKIARSSDAGPAQGALLLTPAPAAADVGPQGDAAVEPELADGLAMPQSPLTTDEGQIEVPAPAFAEVDRDGDDFDDDEDEGPVTPLAARVRALPPEASARKIGAELLPLVARLQRLRDRMADAARTGRS